MERVITWIDRFQQERTALAFIVGVVKKFGDDRAGRLAALVAYYGFFSLFPLMLVLVAVLGFVLEGRPELRDEIADTAFAQIPLLGDQLRDQAGSPLTGSAVALVVGIGGALWAGLAAMQAAQDALNEVWGVPRVHWPNFVAKRLRSLLTLAIVGVLLITAGALSQLSTLLGLPGGSRVLVVAGTLVVASTVFLVAFKVLGGPGHSWRTLMPGAAVAGVAYYALQVAGQWYVRRTVDGAQQAYGTFAIVIGLLSWLYLQAQMTMLAAEVNVVLARHQWPRSLRNDHLTEADEDFFGGRAKAEQMRDHEHIDVEFSSATDQPD